MVQAQVEVRKTSGRTRVEGWSNPCEAPPLAKGKAKIRLHHVSAPTCWWSWGYYGALARVRLVYGNQVEMNLPVFAVYEDLDHWIQHNGMDVAGWEKWAQESAEKMGVPIFTGYGKTKQPKDVTGPMFATIAALRQGAPKGERFQRALLRRSIVEGVDVTGERALVEAAKEAGLDVARFKRDLADREGLDRDIQTQESRLPNVPLGFYNLCLEDDRGRKIVLDYTFEPDEIVDAIEYLSGGSLKKNTPDDPVAFLAATGPAHAVEVARAFGWPLAKTESTLKGLEAKGRLRRVTLGGAPHWTTA